jgi:hypothetical protein
MRSGGQWWILNRADGWWIHDRDTDPSVTEQEHPWLILTEPVEPHCPGLERRVAAIEAELRDAGPCPGYEPEPDEPRQSPAERGRKDMTAALVEKFGAARAADKVAEAIETLEQQAAAERCCVPGCTVPAVDVKWFGGILTRICRYHHNRVVTMCCATATFCDRAELDMRSAVGLAAGGKGSDDYPDAESALVDSRNRLLRAFEEHRAAVRMALVNLGVRLEELGWKQLPEPPSKLDAEIARWIEAHPGEQVLRVTVEKGLLEVGGPLNCFLSDLSDIPNCPPDCYLFLRDGELVPMGTPTVWCAPDGALRTFGPGCDGRQLVHCVAIRLIGE